MTLLRLAAIVCCALTLGACPGDGGGGGDAPDAIDDTADGPDPRTFLLAGVAEGFDIAASSPRVFSLEALGDLERLEALVVPVDLLGVPWSAFTGPDNQPGELPGAWVSAVYEMRDAAQATGRPLILSLSPFNGDFDSLAPEAHEEAGLLILRDKWLPGSQHYCFDPSAQSDPTKWEGAYAGYVRWIVAQFDAPRWVTLASRVNLYEENCGAQAPAAYPAVVGFALEAHRRLRAEGAEPVTIVGVDVEDLYGFPKQAGRCEGLTPAQCFAERAPLLDALGQPGGEGTPDRLGLVSYPAVALPSLSQGLPADWLSRIVDARSDLPPVVLGTALPPRTLQKQEGVCLDLLVSSAVEQRSWLDQVLALAGTEAMELVTWHPLRDLLPGEVVASCPCAGDAGICDYLGWIPPERADAARRLVTGGLWGLDDSERLAGTLWLGVLAPSPEGGEDAE